MFTWWSESAFDTSRSSRERSSAFTSIEATNTVSASPSQSTSMSRSLWPVDSDTAFAQSARCTDTPRPRVTNPMISSPGTGVQHRESRTMTSSRPSTWTPAPSLRLLARRGARAVSGSCSSRVLLALAEDACVTRSAIDVPDTWFSPIAALEAVEVG